MSCASMPEPYMPAHDEDMPLVVTLLSGGSCLFCSLHVSSLLQAYSIRKRRKGWSWQFVIPAYSF